MAEQERAQTDPEGASDAGADAAGATAPSADEASPPNAAGAVADAPSGEAAEAPASEATATPTGEAAGETGAPADPWAAVDAVLEEFARERPVGAGTFYAEDLSAPVGRFAGWANAAGWECAVRLVREPSENVTIVVVEGPPLAGGRPRQLPLSVIPAEFEPETLRVSLEFAYLIAETWGPREEPAPPSESTEHKAASDPAEA